MDEEDFLELFKFTGPDVKVEDFYCKCQEISSKLKKESFDAFKRGVKDGQEMMIKIWNYKYA